MGNWRKVCTGLTVIILCMMVYLSFFGSPITELYLEQQVQQHLLDSGLEKEDILSKKVSYQRDKQINYVVQVVFADEPEIVHYYYCNIDREIQEMEQVSE